jgi:hypothetical protein
MTTPTGRDNGLPPASRYVALVDVDPPVADHVLELLREAGVTAVAEPLAGDRGPARDTPPPRRPTERVHVDVDDLGLARTVVGQALPALRADFHADAARRSDIEDAARDRRRLEDLAAEEIDSRFADIVATFDTGSDEATPPWPKIEDSANVEPPEEAAPRPPLSSRLLRSTPEPVAAVPVDEHDPDEHDPDEHFVPEPPPPLPETDRVTRLAWAALLGGPALVVLAALLHIGLDPWIVVLSLVAFLGGFATLVARMHDRGPDDDWDDGAVL